MHDRKRLAKSTHPSPSASGNRGRRRTKAKRGQQSDSRQLRIIVGSVALIACTIVSVWIATSWAREAVPQTTSVAAVTPQTQPIQPQPAQVSPNRTNVVRTPAANSAAATSSRLDHGELAPPKAALFAKAPQSPSKTESAGVFTPQAPREVYGPQPNPAGGSGADFDALIELIQTTVSPDTWEDVGGPGTISSYETGVRADPQARLAKISLTDNTGRLEAMADQISSADLQSVVDSSSDLRILSLPRLERAVAAHRELGQPLPESLRYLAGLTAVRYVFVYPQEGEVVIAGPAEPWEIDDEGRPLGVESGRPILQLDDLVVMLRLFAPSGQGNFGCSINPREENLKQVKQFVEASQAAGPLAPGMRGKWLRELRNRMGMQDVEIYGVPRETRVAKIIFDADYRMKLIGIGKLDGGPNVPDFFTLLRRNHSVQGIPLTALRWWLTMKYDGILHSPTRDAFEICGSSVLVQSENQFVTAQGKRIQTGKAEPINRQFAENFTQHYDEIAEQDKVFAELQNVFDLAMASAICRRDGLFEMIGWNMGDFAPQGRYQVAEVETPEEIESVLNHRLYGGRDIVVQIAGGVVGHADRMVNNQALQGESAKLDKTRAVGDLTEIPADRWWWDARN